MALQLQDLMMRLQPPSPSKLDLGGIDLQRQHLQLMQQQFEETKRRNLEDEQLRKIAEQNAMRRAQMESDRQAAEAAARADAETMKQRREAMGDIEKYKNAGDYAGMSMAADRLNASGGLAQLLGSSPQGLPSYRLGLDANQARQQDAAQAAQLAQSIPGPGGDETLGSSLGRLSALGYMGRDPLTEAGVGNAPALSTEDAFRQAQAAAHAPADADEEPPAEGAGEMAWNAYDASQNEAPSTFERTGRPARGPDAPDMMGGIPSDVMDTGAMNAATQQRLGPVMAAIQRAYPGAYQQSVGDTNEAVAGMALPPEKSLELSEKIRAPIDSAIGREREHELKMEEEQAKAAAPLKPTEERQLVESGRKAARDVFKLSEIGAAVKARGTAQEVRELFTDDHPENDSLAVNKILDLDAQKGTQSDRDAMRAEGLEKGSTATQFKAWLYTHVKGGTLPQIRDSLMAFVDRIDEREKAKTHDFLANMNYQARHNSDARVAAGYQEFIDGMPQWLRDEYNQEQQADQQGDHGPDQDADTDDSMAPPGRVDHEHDQDFDEELEAEAADAGLNPSAIRGVIGPESKGDPRARNKRSGATGIIQFMPEIAASMGTTTDELRKMSRLEQLPYVIQYFKDRGLTAEQGQNEYYTAVAAGGRLPDGSYIWQKPRSYVVYPKGSKGWEQNEPWRPADGGDITVGSIQDYGGGAKKPQGKGSKGADDAALLEGL